MKTVTMLIMLLFSLPLFAQVDFDLLNFQEAFREGVLRFHRGSYNEAILSLERALGFAPDDYLARVWLGRAYYFSGFEDAALNEWRRVEGQAPPFLRSFADSIEARKSLTGELNEDRDFLVIEEFRAEEYNNAVKNPGGMVADGSGNFFLNSFGSNNISLISQNGLLIRNLIGGLRSLTGPFDIEFYGDRLYVTNFLGDYVSVLNTSGNTVNSFGSAGIGEGQLLGPQYLSISREPALYVSDVGNRRVVKFSLEGEYLFHFGEPAAFRYSPSVFEGFSRIGGLAAVNDGLYVADNHPEYSDILFFDNSGNILERFTLENVSAVEDLTATRDDQLVITSRNAVYLFSPATLSLDTLYVVNENENAQFVSAGFDDNQNLLISDFRNDRLLFLSRLSGIYSGYQVELQRIDSSDFPRILIELSVRDILGNDILGLEEENFRFTEEGLPLDGWSMEYNGSTDTVSSAAFIVEASGRRNDANFRNQQRDVLLQALNALPDNTVLRIFSAGISPVLEFDRNDNPTEIPALMSSIVADPQWRLDQAIRLTGDRLILDQSKREIVFLGNGTLPDWAFDSLGLSQTLAYLQNNHIRFNLVHVSDDIIDPALIYLIEKTGGSVYTGYRPQGMAELGENFLSRRNGLYMFSGRSLLSSGFGREYLPVEAEVIHFTKSGRDEAGYFAPLEF